MSIVGRAAWRQRPQSRRSPRLHIARTAELQKLPLRPPARRVLRHSTVTAWDGALSANETGGGEGDGLGGGGADTDCAGAAPASRRMPCCLGVWPGKKVPGTAPLILDTQLRRRRCKGGARRVRIKFCIDA